MALSNESYHNLYDSSLTESDSELLLEGMLTDISERYQYVYPIAIGGMKQVSCVLDLKTQRRMAMAQLRPKASKELYPVFIREAWLIARLDHPNIISVLDMGTDEAGRPFFTMELKVGQTLEELLSVQGPSDPPLERVPLHKRLEIFLKICDAMEYAHSHQILHLDLKPSNIQVGQYGEVKVCDWGLGRLLNDPNPIPDQEQEEWLQLNTLHGHIQGTPGYMSPEQTEPGHPKSEASDIYSLGALLYFILTGNCPLDLKSENILESTRSGNWTPPAKRFPELKISISLNAIVIKAMKLDPAERYSSVLLLAADLRATLQGYPTVAENPSSLRKLWLLYRRNALVSTTSLFFLTSLLLLGGISFLALEKSRQKQIVARQEAERHLAMYQTEKKLRQSDMTDYSSNQLQTSSRLFSFSYFDNPVEAIDLTLSELDHSLLLNPQNLQGWQLKGEAYFLEQNFSEALECFKKSLQPQDPLLDLCRKYQTATTRKKGSLLPLKDFYPFLKEVAAIPKRPDLAEKIVAYDSFKRGLFKGYDQALLVLLRQMNPENPETLSITYDPATLTCRVSGRGVRDLSAYSAHKLPFVKTDSHSGQRVEDNFPLDVRADRNISLLRFVPIRKLDLRGTSVFSLRYLRFLSLTSLDIRDTAITELTPLKRLEKLQELIIEKDQFPPDQLAWVPAWVHLAIKDPENPAKK